MSFNLFEVLSEQLQPQSTCFKHFKTLQLHLIFWTKWQTSDVCDKVQILCA